MRKKLFSMLALLLVAVTGAWADTVVLGTPDESVSTHSDANGIITITDGSGSAGVQQGSSSYKITYDGTEYVPMKFSGSRNFTLSYKEGVTISKVTLLSMSNGDAAGTVGAGDGDAVSLGTFPARNTAGNCLTVDITGKTGLRGSRQFLAIIVVDYTATSVEDSKTTYDVTVKEGTEDAANWTINPTSADAGEQVTLKYNGTRKVVSVKGVKKPVLLTAIKLNKTATEIEKTKTETLSVEKFTPARASDKTVTWSSDNTAVATVNAKGEVTAVAEGTANITATANDGSGVKATCAVTVKPQQVNVDNRGFGASPWENGMGGTLRTE